MTKSAPHDARRPLKVRDAGLAKRVASWLTQRQVKPNHISMFSVVFALVAAASLFAFSQAGAAVWWPLLAAFAVQGRLLCNLFDGMVAVEGGMSTPAGELFNDIPDRIADPLILVAFGFAAIEHSVNMHLAWCAGLLALATAYVRTLASSIGAPTNFVGPMAKQHRMAVVTLACVLVMLEVQFFASRWSLSIALWLIVVGSIFTVFRRTRLAYQHLESSSPDTAEGV